MEEYTSAIPDAVSQYLTRVAREYTAETADAIRGKVEKVQKRASARLLNKEMIEEAIRDIETYPAGYITADGGAVAKAYKARAETTVLYAAWYTWRHKKWIVWDVYRSTASKVPYGRSSEIVKNFDSHEAWKHVLEARFIKCSDLKIRRQAKRNGIILPPDKTYAEILDHDGGMMLLRPYMGSPVLCSPFGQIDAPCGAKTVYEAAKSIGITLPHRKADRTWDKVESLWVINVLSKL